MKRKRSSFKEITAAFLFLIMVVTVTFSASYAVLSAQIRGQKSYSLAIGDFDFSFKNEQNSISLLNAYPMTDEEGKQLEAYKFSITNTGDYKGDYAISLVEAEEKKSQCTNCTFLDPSMLRYELTKEGKKQTPKDVAATMLLDEGTLKPKESANYELRIWLKQEATVAEEGKIYYGKIKVEAVQSTQNTLGTVSDYAFAEANLGENCTTYNDGTDTFLVGQCSKNYVWYSGKLWRVVLKNNETGAVKMITDNAITTISLNNSGNTSYANSYVDQWLTQEFLPILHNTEDYLVDDSQWDIAVNVSNTPIRSTNPVTINRTAGLLSAYEYYTVYNKSDDSADNYLNNHSHWWLINSFDNLKMNHVLENGILGSNEVIQGFGVRPSIILNTNVHATSGAGTIDDPLLVENESKENIKMKRLSTRYSGEYVKFNNELYRIVGVEDNLVKITAVNKLSSLKDFSYHSVAGVVHFPSSDIYAALQNYYQTIPEFYQSMIKTDSTWYLGTVEIDSNYKKSICETVDINVSTVACEKTTSVATSSIGLPRVGEMFTSEISRENRENFWTLTPFSSTSMRAVNYNDHLISNATTLGYGARPSIYLKENAVIASTNTGNGTYEHPYDIELGS